MKYTTFIGLDVHKETISVAIARAGWQDAEFLKTIGNNADAIVKLVRQLGKPGELFFCYEAGPCGYAIHRQLISLGAQCIVAAPSLIPQQVGKRVKTDRLDAKKLARLLRSGELTPVWVPNENQEALRDLVRAREEAKKDAKRKKNQIGKLLLRLELRPPRGVNAWTCKYRLWLESLKFKTPAQEMVIREYIHALDDAEAMVRRFEAEIAELAKDSDHAPVIEALQALKGVQLITAVTVVAEVGDITRFANPRQLMSYAGLVPSEHSSGANRHQGGITRTGNAHLRRIVIEAAWHYRRVPRVGAALKKRQEGLSEEVKAIAWKAQHRLNLRYRCLTGRGKMVQTTVTALARELLGFMWAIGKEVEKQRCSIAA